MSLADTSAIASSENDEGARASSWAHILRFAAVAGQLWLLVLVVDTFQLEGQAFLRVCQLALGGFIVHHLLPQRFRMPFFVGLSVVGIGLVFGVANGMWLVGVGLALIGAAHLPVPFSARLGVLLALVAALVAFRAGWVASPWPPVIWPILGSMFMFRMIIYLYDLKHKSAPFSPWRAFAYFFMLPNVCFPLFPVVDYKGFCRSYYNDEDLTIYQVGIEWMCRGLIHLLLYRFLYQNFLLDPANITTAGTAAMLVVSTFLLYLRISGSFHFIVGLMHLFGFNLIETNHNWLLSSSYTNFWRRINIYWKDFMQKIFFNPAYLKLNRKLGDTGAMVVATLYVFAVTWFLHSYQWFWIRGSFPVIWQDVFWAILALVVIATMLYETKYGRRRSLKKQGWSLKSDLGVALRTILTFVSICVLWNMWTSRSFAEFQTVTAKLFSPGLQDVVLIGGGLVLLGIVAIVASHTPREQAQGVASKGASGLSFWQSSAVVAALAGTIVTVGANAEFFIFEPKLANAIDRLRSASRLSQRDASALERGYYEDLTDVTRFSPELASVYRQKPVDWEDTPMLVPNEGGFPAWLPIPSTEVMFKNARLTTNRWAMRDRDYEKTKSPRTFRIAIVGASHTLGSGVEDHESYENVAEDRLNREYTHLDYDQFEILNFAVGGYGPMSRLATLEQRILEFKPDAVIWAGIDDFRWIVFEMSHANRMGLDILPYDLPREVAKKAGFEPGLPQIVTDERIKPYTPELISWVYGRFAEICRENEIEPLAVYFARPENEREDVRLAEQKQLAGEAGMTLLDMSGVYDGQDLKSLWVAAWDRHPNATGHQLLAEKFYPSLVDYLDGVEASPEPSEVPGEGATPAPGEREVLP